MGPQLTIHVLHILKCVREEKEIHIKCSLLQEVLPFDGCNSALRPVSCSFYTLVKKSWMNQENAYSKGCKVMRLLKSKTSENSLPVDSKSTWCCNPVRGYSPDPFNIFFPECIHIWLPAIIFPYFLTILLLVSWHFILYKRNWWNKGRHLCYK